MIRLSLAALLVALFATASQAQGTIAGCATDRCGAALPGVEVVVTNAPARPKVVTDATGCYEIRDLAAGTYTVTAVLSGFQTGTRDAVTVLNGETTRSVDFSLCVGRLAEVLWVMPGSLEEMWKRAPIVVYLRVERTGPGRAECWKNDFEHTARVIEVLKAEPDEPIGETLTFLQENWPIEPGPYAVGQRMVIFLARTRDGLVRAAGPFGVFLFDGDRVRSRFAAANTDNLTPAQFLDRLRALAKSGR